MTPVREQLYFSIFHANGWFQYHVSTVKEEVEKGQAMSRRISTSTNSDVDYLDRLDGCEARWREEAKEFKSIEVKYKG